MDINTTIDAGQNLTALLERLAAQIGTTADKIFPWYVQQAYLEGVTVLWALVIFLVVFCLVFILACRKADWNGSPSAFVAVVSGAFLILSLLAIPLEGLNAVRKITNPNYYAVHMLTRDLGRLMGK